MPLIGESKPHRQRRERVELVLLGEMIPKLKADGRRGSWFAEVDGESLPCVHQHWCRRDWYHDPNAYREHARKWDELIEAIREKKKVIVTTDNVIDERSTFVRTGYVAVFEVDQISLDGFDLRFRLVKRVANLV